MRLKPIVIVNLILILIVVIFIILIAKSLFFKYNCSSTISSRGMTYKFKKVFDTGIGSYQVQWDNINGNNDDSVYTNINYIQYLSLKNKIC